MDDTLNSTLQAAEDALVASIEAGLFPDIEAVNDICHLPKNTVILFRVPRKIAEKGLDGGLATAFYFERYLVGLKAKVCLTFDGWASDPRELHEIPEIRAFCGALIRRNDAFGLLIDETTLFPDPRVYEITGKLWVVRTAYAAACYERDQTAKSGWSWSLDKTLSYFREALKR